MVVVMMIRRWTDNESRREETSTNSKYPFIVHTTRDDERVTSDAFESNITKNLNDQFEFTNNRSAEWTAY